MKKPLVFQSDFGIKERFAASMKGVAVQVDPQIVIHDITHFIDPYNVWEAAWTLMGTLPAWPEGTVFVSVVDPGVGTSRRSVAARTKDGKFVVTPDNGTLTFVSESPGVDEIREIDEIRHRRKGTEDLHTFHGRDLYAVTGAKLASGLIDFGEIGPVLNDTPVIITHGPPEIVDDHTVSGTITKIEVPYGNIVTNIPGRYLDEHLHLSENDTAYIEVFQNGSRRQEIETTVSQTFGNVEVGNPILYIDSIRKLGLAANRGNFAGKYGIGAGPEWTIRISDSVLV